MTPPALLRQARTSAGLTQAGLAQRLGTTQSAIAQLEHAHANPTVDRLEAALRATGHRLELTLVAHQPSVDETLLARNLRMTPAERLAAFETAHRELEELKKLATDAR